MNVVLASEIAAIVAEQIKTGRFENQADVIAAGLTLLDLAQFDEARRRHEALKQDVQAAIDQSERGESKPFDKLVTLRRAHEAFERQG